jgi:hypothetical protein
MAKAGAWFNEAHAISWDSGQRGETYWSGRIIGVAEYGINTANYPFVVRVASGFSRDLFVGFNVSLCIA